MRLHFDPNLDFQHDAIEAVCNLFRGQEICRTEFTVTNTSTTGQLELGVVETELGIGNRLSLRDDALLSNLIDVQLRNGIAPSAVLGSGDFTIEMETGTGKTYVYLRSIFELNKRFGFAKFVIVVPSVAIKEGVYKTLQMTEEHFRALYAGVPYEYFLYDSTKLGQVRGFATSSQIQIMVVTVGAINKQAVNNLYKDTEKTGGDRPIDLIRATAPVVIVDEPQSVDGGLGGRGREALNAMDPLCTLRYSATHVHAYHMVYRLDAVDAYERKLVKQIEVASATVADAFNKPFVRFIGPVVRGRRVVGAKVELDVKSSSGVRRAEVVVEDGDDLELVANRDVYRGCRVGEVRAGRGAELLELRVPGDERYLALGETFGDVDSLAVQRQMIRRTIREHLDKERRLRPIGIKVLSLFFVDAVEKYRLYDEGRPVKGEYAQIFEEEYQRLAHHPDYEELFEGVDIPASATDVHGGYFSIDKRGGWADTTEGTQAGREDAERAYSLIMRDKEGLLSLETPLKFIFSHSALREGWDNPNVLQICSLREMRSVLERRQAIGRGLRLCVNQEGERQQGFEINTLTVVASESYEAFAEGLQNEIEKDTGIRFGMVEKDTFASLIVLAEDGSFTPLGAERSSKLWEFLRSDGYIDGHGHIEDSLRQSLKDETLSVPQEFGAKLPQIVSVLRKLAGSLRIRNADERKEVAVRKAVLLSPEFGELWVRIKQKTAYRVDFDDKRLIEDCVSALREAPPVMRTRLEWRKAGIAIGHGGVDASELAGSVSIPLDEADMVLPDLVSQIQDGTQLTRRSIVEILLESGRVADFRRNPQEFIDLTTDVMNRCKQLAIVDGIRYQRIGTSEYYAQELFEKVELTGYLKNMLVDAKKSVYENVVYDSELEGDFAGELESADTVKVYAKLPGWFTVPTPLGSYNPDWAVVVGDEGEERLYFVVETKGSVFADDLRGSERAKVACGKAHFSALAEGESPARYVVARTLADVLAYA